MAASFLRRVCPLRQSSTRYLSILNSNSKLFSSINNNNNDSNPRHQNAAKNLNVDADKTSNFSPESINDQASSGLSPSEGAVDKFFKVVKRVKETQEKAESSDLITPGGEEDPNESFASMIRRSKLVSLGDVKGRVVEGTVVEMMGEDLYVDFGGKFHCVCPRPKRNPWLYHRGTKVLVNLQALEMSSAFLGSDIHVTLLEGDGTLLGLAETRNQRTNTARQ